jgi:hypothetical protein
MSINFKYVRAARDERTPRQMVADFNNPALPGGVIDKVLDQFNIINNDRDANDAVFIPILPPFFKKHNDLIELRDFQQQEVSEPAEPAEGDPVQKAVASESEAPESAVKNERRRRELTAHEKAELRPIQKTGQIHFRLYPYTFTRPNETIEAVVRLYNDMNVSRAIINKLVLEFSAINKEALPPKLGQTVQVPVLLPFCYRHENDNKIFTDE